MRLPAIKSKSRGLNTQNVTNIEPFDMRVEQFMFQKNSNMYGKTFNDTIVLLQKINWRYSV